MLMNTDLSLVILAAGLGSRFGGDKQLASLGPHGETMLELSLLSAHKAGFHRAVLVIRPELEATLVALLANRLPSSFDIHYCYQSLTDLPVALDCRHRLKPWGTAHALWSARHLVRGPMAVINADDYYGDSAFVCLAQALTRQSTQWTMVAYPLALTLSEHGGVNRGLCQVEDGALQAVAEWTDIREQDGRLVGESPLGTQAVAKDALVSMTCWGFAADVFDHIEAALCSFIATQGQQPKSECYLPNVVQTALEQGKKLTVQVATEQWLGVTYAQDTQWVTQKLTELLGD